MLDLKIRVATRADDDQIYRIRHAGDENTLEGETAIEVAQVYPWFIAEGLIFIGEDRGRVVGFSAADTRDGSIWALFIDPTAERQGVGTALLAHALDHLRQSGFERAALSTDARSYAAGFYQRRGWRISGQKNAVEIILEYDL